MTQSISAKINTKNGQLSVELKSFSFVNKAGGTGMSNWKYDTKFSGTAIVEITKSWEDYECGHRFHGKAISPDLIQYLAENAKADDQRVFFSQFEVL